MTNPNNQPTSKEIKWQKVPGGNNQILEADDFYVSYNKTAGSRGGVDDPFGIGEFAQMLGGILHGESEPQEETALTDGDKWYILLGDFRKEYEKAFPKGFKACLAVFKKHEAEYRSEWSTN